MLFQIFDLLHDQSSVVHVLAVKSVSTTAGFIINFLLWNRLLDFFFAMQKQEAISDQKDENNKCTEEGVKEKQEYQV